MARVTVEDCLESTPSRFALVLLVSKRAKQLLKGATATKAATGTDNKYVVNALREVAAGSVAFHMSPEDGTHSEQIQADLSR